MGWTGYIRVLRKRSSTSDVSHALIMVHGLCSKFVVLPGSEPLMTYTQDADGTLSRDYPGYLEISLAGAKVQSSINPFISLWCMMVLADNIARKLGDDFLVEFADDYGNFASTKLSFLDFAQYFLLGCVLSPVFFVMNFRVLTER